MARSASTWRFNEFKELGILYEEKYDEVDYFSKIIKRKITDRAKQEKLSSLTEYFVKTTDDYWNCSVDLNFYDDLEETTGITTTIKTMGQLDNNIVGLKTAYDAKIKSYLPSDTSGREKALEDFARYI